LRFDGRFPAAEVFPIRNLLLSGIDLDFCVRNYCAQKPELVEACLSEQKSYGDKGMQIEDYCQAGPNAKADGILAQGALKEFEQDLDDDWESVHDARLVSNRSAQYGLALAVPLSLSIWMALGALLWALTR
jgi:hypothetical protein